MINLGSRLVSRLNSDCWHRRYWHVLNRLARNTKLPLHHEPAPISAAYRLLFGAPPRISLRCPTVQQLRATPTDKTLRRRPTFSFSKSAAYETLRGCLIRRKDRTKVNPDEQLQHRRLVPPLFHAKVGQVEPVLYEITPESHLRPNRTASIA